jgi:alkanesulfonate monooxygenase SsuD/methylene tetrahydromethanopterin reductase-like flavin-dependent oxidoreductase (luciferase family)
VAWRDARARVEAMAGGVGVPRAGGVHRGRSGKAVGQQRLIDLSDRGEVLDSCLYTAPGTVGGGGAATTWLVGSYDEVAAALRKYADLGITHFILSDAPYLRECARIGDELLPRLRAGVGAEARALAGSAGGQVGDDVAGRRDLGIGTGAFWDAIGAMGGPRRTAGESVDALREAIAVIRALWTPGRGARLAGRHYQLNGAKPGPFPAHDIGIWVGAYKERMLRLTGELADGWLPSSPYAPPEQLAAMNAIIDAAAVDAGRPPAAVRRIYNIGGSFDGSGSAFLQGPPKVWAEQLAGLALDEGISGFVLMADDALTVERFAAEVAPSVRELVASERGSAARPQPDDVERTVVSPDPSATPAPGSTAPAGRPAATATVSARELRERLGVAPTPDDGVRLSAETVWDESGRPLAPAPDPAATYAEFDRTYARDLVAVHDHLRSELTQLRDMISQVAAGSLDVADARSEINKLTMRQNQWTVGAYCESYCRLIGLHHTLETTQLFPGLSRLDGRLAPVTARLDAEHEIIAGLLSRVDAALVALVTDPVRGMPAVQSAVDLLTDALLSHLSYEEHQLLEPLARFGPVLYGR